MKNKAFRILLEGKEDLPELLNFLLKHQFITPEVFYLLLQYKEGTFRTLKFSLVNYSSEFMVNLYWSPLVEEIPSYTLEEFIKKFKDLLEWINGNSYLREKIIDLILQNQGYEELQF